MDSFSLDSIREAFEADVTRGVAQARASLQRCLAAMPRPEGWATVAHGVQALAAKASGAEDWSRLADAVARVVADEGLAREVLLHLESACATMARLLTLELSGQRDEAASTGARQKAATDAMLAKVAGALAATAPAPRAPARGKARIDAGELLQNLCKQVAAPFLADSDLVEVEHCYHAIRGSSGMVALASMADSAAAIEELVARSRALADAYLAALQEIATVGAGIAAAIGGEVELAWQQMPPPPTPRPPQAPGGDADGLAGDAAAALGAEALSSFEFDSPTEVRADGQSRISALETAMTFGGARSPAADAAAAPKADDFGADLFDSPSLAIPADGAGAGAAESPQSFEFGAEPPAGAVPVASGSQPDLGVDGELVEIFLEEARQCLPDLRRSFARLREDPADCGAWLDLSRHFHLLKGSAGTVGIATIARAGAALEDKAEAFGERRRQAHKQDVAAMHGEVTAMLATCRLQLEEAPAAAAVTPAATDSLAEVFAEEGRGILRDVGSMLAGKKAARELGEQDLAALAALLHRLKGSALLQGSDRVGKLAAALHDLCDQAALPGDGLVRLTAGLAELATLLGAAPPVLAVQPVATGGSLSVTIEADAAVWEAFQIEVQELLEQLDRIALELDGAEQPRTRLDAAFRCLHTLKGACNTVGLSPTGAMLHEVENWLELLQKADVLPPLPAIARVMLDALDAVKRHLKQAQAGAVVDALPAIRARIAALQANPSAASTPSPQHADRSVAASSQASARSSSADGESDFGGGRGTLRVSAERLDRLMDLIGELVVHRSQLRSSAGAIQKLQSAMKKSRQRLFATIDRFREQYEFNQLVGKRRGRAAGRGQGPVVPRPADRAPNEAGFSDIELDHYEDINILARSLEEIDSDLAQIQSQIDGEIEAFHQSSDGFGGLISSLQGEITEARMVAVDQLFLRLRRPVRDAAERLGREVRVVTSGDDVTLDKTIIDQLFAPMLHLVRNAVAHGIEPDGDRAATGKDRAGTIHLAARQESGQIVIEVRDDGRGLDLPALHRIGLERGLLPPGTAVDDPRVKELIFVSGLSTKQQADAVSGRGVGCDVVRRAIEHLSGVIDVITEAGRGTTFRITMPLTLAIYRALLVKHAGLTFALPISFSERIVDGDEAEIFESSGVRRLQLDGEYIEVRDLSQMLGMPVAASDSRLTVVLRLGPDRIAVHIDEVLGQDEIVVKSLGDVLTGHQMFSGVTIDGDGNLILILDVTGLFHASGRSTAVRTTQAIASAVGTVSKPAAAASRRVRVLYADDSLSVRKAAEKFLNDIGADLVLAVDGADALEKLRSQAVDMVFTDIEMPRMHGFDLLREMRYVPAFKDVPVVVVTSRSGDKHRQQAEKLGCNGYLAKPFTPAMLQAQIVKLTGAVAGPGGLLLASAEAVR